MKKLIALVLALLLFTSLLPAISLADEAGGGVFIEDLLSIPSGYESPTFISQIPSGGFAVAAMHKDSGKWAMLVWQSATSAPEVIDLNYEGEDDISSVSIAPDGTMAVLLNPLSGMMMSGPGGRGPGGGPSTSGSGDGVSRTEIVDVNEGDDDEDEDAFFSGKPVEGAEEEAAPADEPMNAGDGPMTFRGPGDLKTTVVWLGADGAEISRVEVRGMLGQIVALDGQRFAAYNYESGVIIYDAEGNASEPFGLSGGGMMMMGGTQIAASGETIYVLAGGKLTSYDAKSGQRQLSLDIPLEGTHLMQVAPDGTIYLMGTEGIFAVDEGLTEARKLMDAIGTYFGDPSSSILGLAALPDGSLAALISETGGGMSGGGGTYRIGIAIGGGGDSGNLLAIYRHVELYSLENKQDFTITALRNSDKLRKAANDFQRLHPELNVILQTQMAQDDDSPVEDHIRTLNTDLLAGKGGDVLVLDGLPMDKYARRGLLLDIKDIFADVGLLPGIRAACEEDGKMYFIPAQFTFKLFWGRKQFIDQLNNLHSFLDLQLEDGQTPMSAREYSDWLELFYYENEPFFSNHEGKPDFSSPEFAEFLETLYGLYDGQGEIPTDSFMGPGGRGSRAGMAESLSLANGATVIAPATVSGLMGLAITYSLAGAEDSAFILPPTLKGTSPSFTPSLTMGINSQSKSPALAEEFIRMMLSAEVQEMGMMDGLPTIAASLDKLIEDAIERNQDTTFFQAVSISGGTQIDISQPDEDTLRAIRALCDTLDLAIYPDDTLFSFIAEETESFFAGRMNADAAGRAIEQRAWQYLNE